ncbi:MAG: type II secretion system F family protein [Candidatus Euphemobacter frigidus]|nr:type II secretion system F family protein [Candidatus Euphemobacter frigidus]MDP8275589.1 type II secretion system F family protein [Candidatus Euphemobacter frigidus]
MSTFRYKARSETGKSVSGSLEAQSREAVISHLEEMGYTPISVREETTRAKGGGDLFARFEKVKPKDLVMMTRQLHSLIKSGIPILTSLNILEKQCTSALLQKTLSQIQEKITGGASFSDALRQFPKVFSDLYVNTVLAGETGGALPEVLDRLASLLESEQATRKAVKSAVRYPMIAVVIMIAAFFILNIMVVPKFAAIYGQVGLELPLPTKLMMASSHIINHYYYVIIGVVVALIVGLSRFNKTKFGHYQLDKLKLKLPIFGPLFTKLAMFRFTKMLATLERSGVPILKIIEIISLTVGNDVIGEELLSLRDEVRDGKGLSNSIMKRPIFPPMVSNMLSVGEETGRLDEMAESIAYYYDEEIKYTVATLTDLIEPLLTIFIAGGVLLFALAIFLPMWDMIAVVRG